VGGGAGMRANKAGKIAEETIASILMANGMTFRRQQPVGPSIYPGQICHADFVISNLRAFPNGLAVESKWQASDGSIDEKFPYLVSNIKRGYRMPAIVVVHGGLCRLGAWTWIKAEVDGDRLVAVYRLEEFLKWAMQSEQCEVETIA
jgi:hypothetical protein